jgi:hypothetical protein
MSFGSGDRLVHSRKLKCSVSISQVKSRDTYFPGLDLFKVLSAFAFGHCIRVQV